MNRAETISKIKEQFNSLHEGDKSFIQIDEKQNIVKFGGDLYVCDVNNDPDSCELSSKLEDACFSTIQKASDRVNSELESVGSYLKDKEDDVDSMIPGDDKPKKLTPEEKKQQDLDNELIPDDNDQPTKDDEFIPD